MNYSRPKSSEFDKIRITLPLDELEEAKDWKNGEEYDISLHVKQTGITEKDVTFEVLEAESDDEEDSEEDAEEVKGENDED